MFGKRGVEGLETVMQPPARSSTHALLTRRLIVQDVERQKGCAGSRRRREGFVVEEPQLPAEPHDDGGLSFGHESLAQAVAAKAAS